MIVFLNNLPPRTFKYSFTALTAIAGISFCRLVQGNHDATLAGAYAAFTYGVLVWGWHEMAFFMGFLTGPRKTACPHDCAGWKHFGHGAQACIDHELAILATGVAVVWATWGAPNKIGMWTFVILWFMRLSAKLNVFLGVRNLGEPFLPRHLAYLLSFMRRRPMNWLMPFSLAGGAALTAWLIGLAAAPNITPPRLAGLVFLITMSALAVLEHALLVLPLPFTALWTWWLQPATARKKFLAAFFQKRSPSFP